ncbi:heme-degrading domain-containing protein [Tabrizicola oligotrophica]|uniref:Heme-degrading domain-containing protein n=1 Tax=Tabrizicola oligotrophica TaxID=2710650 RepID=A0A6M0QNW5_9RHOB|nr:heme-degrading domain-containing protein [Tabrizicola oligotrophica]NEY89097.1 heme-degrading domain-containing protein [Tabrizicola oligotrophica]
MTPDFPDSAALAAEAAELQLPRFAEPEALALGRILMDLADGLGVVIDIRTPDRTLFHAALPGAAPANDRWAARKSATAFFFQDSSLAVGVRNRAKGETLEKHGLDPAQYADHGGAVPIRVTGVGVVAVATVSGLPQLDDHRLVVRALQALIAGI